MLGTILLILVLLVLLGALQLWPGRSSDCPGLGGNMLEPVRTITVLTDETAATTISATATIAAGKTPAQLGKDKYRWH